MDEAQKVLAPLAPAYDINTAVCMPRKTRMAPITRPKHYLQQDRDRTIRIQVVVAIGSGERPGFQINAHVDQSVKWLALACSQ